MPRPLRLADGPVPAPIAPHSASTVSSSLGPAPTRRAALTQQIRSQAGPNLDWSIQPRPTRPSFPGRRPTSDHACSASSPGARPAAAAAIPALARQAPSSPCRGERRHSAALARRRRSRALEAEDRGREEFRVNGRGVRETLTNNRGHDRRGLREVGSFRRG